MGLDVKAAERLKTLSLHTLGGSSLTVTHSTRIKAEMTGFALP